MWEWILQETGLPTKAIFYICFVCFKIGSLLRWFSVPLCQSGLRITVNICESKIINSVHMRKILKTEMSGGGIALIWNTWGQMRRNSKMQSKRKKWERVNNARKERKRRKQTYPMQTWIDAIKSFGRNLSNEMMLQGEKWVALRTGNLFPVEDRIPSRGKQSGPQAPSGQGQPQTGRGPNHPHPPTFFHTQFVATHTLLIHTHLTGTGHVFFLPRRERARKAKPWICKPRTFPARAGHFRGQAAERTAYQEAHGGLDAAHRGDVPCYHLKW